MSHAVINESQLLAALMARRSIGKLLDPGPSSAQLEAVFQAALCAPDHGQLKPWRFIVVQGEQRHQLGQFFQQAYQVDAPHETAQHERVLTHPLRAPVLIIAITCINLSSSIPPYEQILSTGAAIENMLLMLDSMNFGAIWRTGFLSESPHLKHLLKLNDTDMIAGFIYTGTPEKWLAAHTPQPLAKYIQYGL